MGDVGTLRIRGHVAHGEDRTRRAGSQGLAAVEDVVPLHQEAVARVLVGYIDDIVCWQVAQLTHRGAQFLFGNADAAMKISELLFKVCGTSSIRGKNGFDRHWRNSRALSLHKRLDYKLHHVGDFYVNGTLPPIDSYN